MPSQHEDDLCQCGHVRAAHYPYGYRQMTLLGCSGSGCPCDSFRPYRVPEVPHASDADPRRSDGLRG